MSRMREEGNRILNTLDEGKVVATIGLYDAGVVTHRGNRYDDLLVILTKYLGMEEVTAVYFLDWFGVKK